MVHDEHDAKFHALNRELTKQAESFQSFHGRGGYSCHFSCTSQNPYSSLLWRSKRLGGRRRAHFEHDGEHGEAQPAAGAHVLGGDASMQTVLSARELAAHAAEMRLSAEEREMVSSCGGAHEHSEHAGGGEAIDAEVLAASLNAKAVEQQNDHQHTMRDVTSSSPRAAAQDAHMDVDMDVESSGEGGAVSEVVTARAADAMQIAIKGESEAGARTPAPYTPVSVVSETSVEEHSDSEVHLLVEFVGCSEAKARAALAEQKGDLQRAVHALLEVPSPTDLNAQAQAGHEVQGAGIASAPDAALEAMELEEGDATAAVAAASAGRLQKLRAAVDKLLGESWGSGDGNAPLRALTTVQVS